MQIEENKDIFAAMIGLIAAGYPHDLAKEGPFGDILRCIRNERWSPDIASYFKRAIPKDKWNDAKGLWASGLCAGCILYMPRRGEVHCFEDFLLLARRYKWADIEPNDDYSEWMYELPAHIDAVRAHAAFDGLWEAHQAIVSEKMPEYLANIGTIEAAIARFEPERQTQLFFIPNLLEAEWMQTRVRRDGDIYFIGSQPAISAILREAVRPELQSYEDAIRNRCEEEGYEFLFDIPTFMGDEEPYDDDEFGDEEIFHEYIMDCIEDGILLLLEGNPEKIAEELEYAREEGEWLQVYMLENKSGRIPDSKFLRSFILRSINACARAAREANA